MIVDGCWDVTYNMQSMQQGIKIEDRERVKILFFIYLRDIAVFSFHHRYDSESNIQSTYDINVLDREKKNRTQKDEKTVRMQNVVMRLLDDESACVYPIMVRRRENILFMLP